MAMFVKSTLATPGQHSLTRENSTMRPAPQESVGLARGTIILRNGILLSVSRVFTNAPYAAYM